MDLNCPYCEEELEINHDEGFGYEENTLHENECKHCGKSFVFTTYISYSYESYKAECLNDGKHDYQLTNTYPREFSKIECTMCGKTRELTEKERAEHGIGSIKDYIDNLKKPHAQT